MIVFNVILQTDNPDIVIISEKGIKKEELYCINFQECDLWYLRRERKSSGGMAILTKRHTNIFSKEIILESAGIEN